MKLKAFHAYDIRGHFGTDLTVGIAYKVAYFLPELLDTRRILVGRDMRLSSPALHDAVIRGLLDAGAEVWDLGLSTTPFVYYVTARHGFKASIQITASHNPKEDNGLKVSRELALPVGYDTGLSTIEQWILEERPTPVAEERGTVHEYDVRDEYVEFLSGFKQDFSNLKIGMDCSNGMASIFVHRLFGEQPVYLYDTLDGSFPNHEANPFQPENVVDLQKLVIAEKCDVGVIYDGDADRVMFIDETGRFIAPDLIIALLGEYFIKEKGEKGIVLQDIRSSKSVAEYLEPLGAEIAMWKVGRAFAAPRLRELDGVWGGEVAGHYYFRDFFYCDSGLLAGVMVLNIVAKLKRAGIRFSEIMNRIKHYENSGEINFRVEDKKAAMDAVKDHFMEAEKSTAFYDFDGYRVEFGNWWFNVRPSNTEPYLRFLCEANSQELLEQKVAEARSVIGRFV
ncbi:MAG: phosphomannomutase/phosphoglucomutase [Bacteroidales bacterium]|jgi:phosphomannomutase|nr:phosphomannomutase/phosphoglucomutase [Bacteroidales bacterium]